MEPLHRKQLHNTYTYEPHKVYGIEPSKPKFIKESRVLGLNSMPYLMMGTTSVPARSVFQSNTPVV